MTQAEPSNESTGLLGCRTGGTRRRRVARQEWHKIPISDRPQTSVFLKLHALIFNLLFGLQLVLIHLLQLIILPLYLIPIPPIRRIHYRGQHYAKKCFGASLLLITSVFAPTKLVITADESVDLNHLVKFDEYGKFIGFAFQDQSVFIANHQQYCDWMQVWIMLALANLDKGMLIILKASLRWVPIIGPAMQLFQFEFISKKRRLQDSEGVLNYAKRTISVGLPFQLLLFPEGTLFSALTKPKSAEFAQKSGVADFDNVLLPRSTGLLYCLRPLLTVMPSLRLYDLTIGYEGVPAKGYAQSYYTLQSWFAFRTPSPRVHLHIHAQPASTLPVGIEELQEGKTSKQLDKETSEETKKEMQEWIRGRWRTKDELMKDFYEKGQFPSGRQGVKVVELRARFLDYAILLSVPLILTSIAVAIWLIVKYTS